MSNTLRFILVVGWLVLGSTPIFATQASGAEIEQQLRLQYPITSVGNNGFVVKAGSVLVVQQDGIAALPAPAEWPCNAYKPSSGLRQTGMCSFNYAQVKSKTRLFQVGEKVYLTGIKAKPTEIIFKVQSIADAANRSPFKAAVSFQFQKGYLDSIKVRDVQDAVSQIFVPYSSGASQRAEPPPARTTATERPRNPASLTLPALFVSAKTPADRLELKSDNSFSLVEDGQPYHGSFSVNGSALELNITEMDMKTSGTIQGNKLTDSSGQVWTLQGQAAAPGTAVSAAPAASSALVQSSAQSILRNQDVIELVKAGLDDAIILATISNSKCQFDTSPVAIFKLRQSRVSDAVVKAMVAAPK